MSGLLFGVLAISALASHIMMTRNPFSSGEDIGDVSRDFREDRFMSFKMWFATKWLSIGTLLGYMLATRPFL